MYEIEKLHNAGWSYSEMAKALGVSVMTIYRWRDGKTNADNANRIKELLASPAPQEGVYYLQIQGLPWVAIGDTMDLDKELSYRQKCVPTPIRLVAWYPGEESYPHHLRWEAQQRADVWWFQYHPDMEQDPVSPKEDKVSSVQDTPDDMSSLADLM